MTEISTEHSQTNKKIRSSGIDIIKIFAAIMVIMVHFFYHTAFYTSIPITGTEFIFPLSVFWTSYTCVPLFMISTGYLMNKKTLSKGYYKSMIKVIVLYLLCSTICLIYRKNYGFDPNGWEILRGYLRYTHSDYAWYVEQYIVMLLLIPFLNAAWNGLTSRKHHAALLATVIFLFSVAPVFFIGFDLEKQIRPFPEYMTNCYPIAYYYLGCYIKKYPPRKDLSNKLFAFSLYLAAILFLAVTSYYQSQNNEDQYFHSYHFFNYCSYPVFAASTGIFLMLFDINIKILPIRRILAFISETTLLTYLLSYIFDLKYYGEFDMKYEYPHFMLRFRHMHEIVPKIYFLSLLSSIGVLIFYKLCEYIANRLKSES